MLILRIKQAEFALRNGRLEEAYRRVTQPAVLEHRRGAGAGPASSPRAFFHAAALTWEKGQFDAAAIDCQRAADLAGQQESILELRQEIDAASRSQARRRRHQEGIADQVRSMIRRGDFEGGQQKLSDLTGFYGPARWTCP